MARPKSLKPSHRFHKPSGRGFVVLNGEYLYTGKWGTQEAEDKYARLIGEWIANGRQNAPGKPAEAAATGTAYSVRMVLAGFWTHAQAKYRTPEGEEAGELDNYRQAMRPLKKLYADTPAAEFGPKRLKVVRDEMIRMGWCRKYVNRQISRIRRIFTWAVAEELIPATVSHALEAVDGLRLGEQGVRESEPVKPVPQADVDAVLGYLPAPVRAMVELQALTAARSGELFDLRTCDVDREGKAVWEYRPQTHKTAHHGHDRVIYFGPKAQDILNRYLRTDLQAPVFSPAASERARHRKQREDRQTPLTPSQQRRGAMAKRRIHQRPPGAIYDRHSYRRAIVRACEKAFKMPKALKRYTPKPKIETAEAMAAWKAAETKRKAAAREWRRENCWHPHQLRHNAATFIRREYGLEAAKVILGHSTLTATQVYAEQDREKAREIIAKVG